VVAALAAVVGVGELTADPAPAQVRATVARVPVAATTLVCPDARADVGTATRIAAAVPPRAPGAAELAPGSRAGILFGMARGATVGELSTPSSALTHRVRTNGPYTLRARGGLAPGATALQLTTLATPERRALAGTPCVAPGTDFWFVGAAAVVGRRSELVVGNAEDAAAELDIELYGPKGRIDVPAARGITVAPGEQTIVKLDALTPRTLGLAVHVVVRAGRVAAAVRDTQTRGVNFRGQDWLPAAAPPSRRIVVPAVPGGAGQRLLHVAAPASSDAVVKIRLLAPSGPFVPAGADVLGVPAGTVGTLDLERFVGGQPVAVELQSDVPVTGSVLARFGGPSGPGDLGWTAAGPALATPTLLADVGLGEKRSATLLLSSAGRATTVRLEPIAAGSTRVPAPFAANVPEGGTVAVRLPAAAGGGTYALRIVPTAGQPVWAGAVVTAGAPGLLLGTVVPVRPALESVAVPPVVADPAVGMAAG
jgi:hypothetical protein